jgi:hypothetical protein
MRMHDIGPEIVEKPFECGDRCAAGKCGPCGLNMT